MKPSARVASLFILLFFVSFNGFQAYLISERISETKTKFGVACSAALVAAIADYNKLKAIDSASTPTHAVITYSSPLSTHVTDTVEQAFIEMVLNSHVFKSIDLNVIDSLFKKALLSKNVNAAFRIDTITLPGRKFERQQLQALWMKKTRKEYFFSTTPMRIPYNSNITVFAEIKSDPAFIKNDLVWPLLAFAFILLIGNTALIFVYRTIRKQKRINEVKTDFINNITHEMKTPITIASAGLDALEHHVPDTERINFYLHTSKKQIHLLNEFVERILDAAVRDVSDFTLKKEKIDLHALFNDLVSSYSVFNGKSVNFKLQGEGPIFIQGDQLHLETAFHNIIDNAIKYSNGSVEISIDIVENNRGGIIKIRDNGMGIPPQFIKNIFEKFFRVPQGDAQSIKGFGLGLYYVSSIVKKHSGSISVHSKPQAGTEFIITLPKQS